jgi:hypothetical protein
MTLAVKSMIRDINAASEYAPCGPIGATDGALPPLRDGARSIRKQA